MHWASVLLLENESVVFIQSGASIIKTVQQFLTQMKHLIFFFQNQLDIKWSKWV